MKKVLTLLCLLAVLVSATGCAQLQGIFTHLDTPEIKKVGNAISWTAVEDAKTYEIYVNGELHDTTTETNYIFKETTADIKVSVMARAENEYVKSKQSEEITIAQNSGFHDADTLVIVLENDKEYSVPTNVKNLKVSGKATNSSILVEERSTDLVITLDNVDLISREKVACIQQRGTAKGSAIIVNLVGDSRLVATPTAEVPATPAKGSGKDGTAGAHGAHGIQYENIVFMGNGNIYLFGAEGGKGGQGAEKADGLAGFFSVTPAGNGGNGGNGGSGFSCSTVILCMDNASKVNVQGGVGGAGGARGVGHASIEGAINDAMGAINDGAKGSNGAACAYTTCIKISGILNET